MLNRVFLLVVAVGSVVFFFESYSLSSTSGTFPRAIAALSFVLIVRELWKGRAAAPSDSEGETPESIVGLKWYWSFCVAGCYLLTIWLFGFWLPTLVMLFVFPPLVGYKRFSHVSIFALLTTVGVGVLFIYFFNIRMPALLW